jgi:hypothetical protein
MSTPDKPILFFQEFFEKNKFKKFFNDFFIDYNNPTFYANLDEDYIEYIKDFYNEGEDSTIPIKIYFKDFLSQQLLPQKIISINLIKDKIESIVNNGNSPDNYTNNVRDSLTKLKTSIVISQTQHKDLVLPILEKIEKTLSNPKPQKSLIDKQLSSGSPFFRPTINKTKLKKIYALARIYEILDIEITSETDFLNVFLSPNPALIENKIIFKSSNREGLFFVFYMEKYFDNLKPSTIARSESFYSKPKKNKAPKVLSESSINNVHSFINNNGSNIKFLKIEEGFKNLEKK